MADSILLLGSLSCPGLAAYVAKQRILLGEITYSIDSVSEVYFKLSPDMQATVDQVEMDMMQLADSVYVLDPDGCRSERTIRTIQAATEMGKPIAYHEVGFWTKRSRIMRSPQEGADRC